MAKWKRGGRRKLPRGLSIYAYVDYEPNPLGSLPVSAPVNMDAAGMGAVLTTEDDKPDCTVEEGVAQEEFLA